MANRYSDYTDAISSVELYNRLLQYGLFSEKLPPIFDAQDYTNYCNKPGRPVFPQKWYSYASYESMRNNNTPRDIGIPTPMAHERICSCLRNNWPALQQHFRDKTASQSYIVSRAHIRKMSGTDSLFQMNYDNWKTDGSPKTDISFGMQYVVKADISKCFPSIYSHAIPWALVSKSVAKQNPNDNKLWYNQLDTEVRNSTNGETHGLLIGPHTSNLLSEIILCAIDESLQKKWHYVRVIDDFTCYVNSKDEADRFLIDLNYALKEYGLSLNHKKTEISEMPIGMEEQWTHQIQDRAVYFERFQPYVDYTEAQAFLDYCVELLKKNKDNAAILFYAIKVLQKHHLTPNAQQYVAKTVTSFALHFPYLVPLLDEYVYTPHKTNKSSISEYINKIYNKYSDMNYYEPMSYALYYATKYDTPIDQFDVDVITAKNDCILALCCLIYCRHFGLRKSLESLKKYAKLLKSSNMFDEFWLFTYECLTIGLVAGPWREMKNDNVSFLKPCYR